MIVDKMFEGCTIHTGTDYLEQKDYYDSLGETIIYTGAIDAYFQYQFGKLEYRSLRFETEVLDMENYQGVAIQIGRRPTPGLLSTNILSLVHRKRRLSPGNTLLTGKKAWRRIIRLMMRKIRLFTDSMNSWPRRKSM